MAVLTDTGEQWIVDKMRGQVTTKQEYIHWGTGSTAEAEGNIALATPGTEARVQGTITSPSQGLHRVIGTLTCNATAKTVTEVGLFDAATSGVMAMRALFTGVPLEQNDQITFTLDITVT
jgi:hypothetical protein